jgi:DNA polymerase elongation subunit (family B)
MIKIMNRINPKWDRDVVEPVLDKMIDKNVRDPEVTLHNNYTNEMKQTKLLSVFDWALERKPIIAGNGTFYKNQHEAINPIARMLEGFLNKRKKIKKEMFAIEDESSYAYKNKDRNQGIQKRNANSYYGASGAKSSPFYSEYSGAKLLWLPIW